MEQILTISIPTYNRKRFLEDNLKTLLDSCQKLSIKIHISDDSTNNDTQIMIEELQNNYDCISYKKNTPSLGHDKNILEALSAPSSEYVWLVGDSLTIASNELVEILETLKMKKYDVISVNASNRRINLQTGIYDNPREIFLNFCWHMTLTGATIYSRTCISSIDHNKASQMRNFPHIFCIFKFLSENNTFFWLNKPVVSLNKRLIKNDGKSYWMNDPFKVFISDWKNVLAALVDPYGIDDCKTVELKHSRMAGVFNLKALLNLRRIGAFNYKQYLKYKEDLVPHSSVNRCLIFFISIFPSIIINHLHRVYSFIK